MKPVVESRWKRFSLLFVPSALSGLLLGLSGPPFFLYWFQFFALIPFLCLVFREGFTWKQGTLAATIVGLVYHFVLAILLEFPIHFAALLAAALTVCWTILGFFSGLLASKLRPPWLLLALPVVATAVDVLVMIAIPVFGTAQSFVRALAAWPPAMAICSITGHSGLVFLVFAFQTGVACVLVKRSRANRRIFVGALMTSVLSALLVLIPWWISSSIQPSRTVRVAAVGWTYEDEQQPRFRRTSMSDQIDRLLSPYARRAAQSGAKLIVAPEIAFVPEAGQKQEMIDRLSALALETRMVLVVGYFDLDRNTNPAIVILPDGQVAGEYLKTHLIPFIEDYVAGDGSLLVVETEVGRLGVVICQDDNFTDLARGYGRQGVEILADPTNDWAQVKDFHLQNSIFRAPESGFAVVRGSSNGISAIIDARGRMLARSDHFIEGTGMIMADLPIYRGGSIYSRLGDWFAFLCAGLTILLLILAMRAKKPSGDQ